MEHRDRSFSCMRCGGRVRPGLFHLMRIGKTDVRLCGSCWRGLIGWYGGGGGLSVSRLIPRSLN